MMNMKLTFRLFLLLLIVSILVDSRSHKHIITEEGRERILLNAISDAKLDAQEEEDSMIHPSRYTHTYKIPSKKALEHHKSRLLFEDMIEKAEKELSHTANDSPFLKRKEIARLYDESGCASVITEPKCEPLLISTYRTIDGTCNNIDKPLQGSANQPFRRLIPPVYEDGISKLKGQNQYDVNNHQTSINVKSGPFDPPFPSASYISQQIIRNETINEVPLTHMVMQWGNFLIHDISFSPQVEAHCNECEETKICKPIHVPSDKKVCLPFMRSVSACTPNMRPRQQINIATSYIDGSHIYGSNEETVKKLRTFKDGLLKSSPGRNLPLTNKCFNGVKECFLGVSFRLNVQSGVLSLHTIWLREHNRIAQELKNYNPVWTDERLFQETRKIIGAMIQKISYVDYLPLIFGQENMQMLIPSYSGYDKNVDATAPNSFTAGALRFGHSSARSKYSRFLSDLYEKGTDRPIHLRDSFFNKTVFLETSVGAIIRGLVTQYSLKIDESVISDLTHYLFDRGFNLAALNIQRGRDHGLPSYIVFRNYCQREFPKLPLAKIESVTTLARLLATYRDINNVDFWIGGLAEEHLPGAIVGPTFACIMAIGYRNLRDGDRFWYENNDGVFTPAQRQEIANVALSSLICRNTNIKLIQRNVFLSNEKRISCKDLPQIDLSKWRETTCYVNIGNRNGGGQSIVAYYYEKGILRLTFGSIMSNQPTTCVPILCPGKTKSDKVIFIVQKRYSNSRNQSCELKHVNKELSQYIYRHKVYLGVGLFQSYIDNNSGVYSTLSNCKLGRISGLKYECQHQSINNQEKNQDKESLDDCLLSPYSESCSQLGDFDIQSILSNNDDDDSDSEKKEITSDDSFPTEHPLNEFPPEDLHSNEFSSKERLSNEFLSDEFPPEEHPSTEFPPKNFHSNEFPPKDLHRSNEFPPSDYAPKEYNDDDDHTWISNDELERNEKEERKFNEKEEKDEIKLTKKGEQEMKKEDERDESYKKEETKSKEEQVHDSYTCIRKCFDHKYM